MGKGFIKGTLLGGLVGAAAALLLAPKSGKETQADLKKAVEHHSNDLVAQLKDISDELATKADAIKDVAKDLGSEAKHESKDLLARVDVLKQDLKIAATKLTESGENVKDTASGSAHKLVDESAAALKELDKLSRTLADSAREKLTDAMKKPDHK